MCRSSFHVVPLPSSLKIDQSLPILLSIVPAANPRLQGQEDSPVAELRQHSSE